MVSMVILVQTTRRSLKVHILLNVYQLVNKKLKYMQV